MDHKEIDITEKFKILGAKYDDSDIPNFLSTLNTWLKYKNALDQIGEVYLTVSEKRSKIGKVSIRIQGSLRELDALTDSDVPLKTGTVIKVTAVTPNGILIIEPLNN